MSKLTIPLLTAARAVFLDRIAATPKRHRSHAAPIWTSIDTAEAQWAAALEGDDLDEAFAALELSEQTLHVDDSRNTACLSPECCFL